MNSFSFKKVDSKTINNIKNKYKDFIVLKKENYVLTLIRLKSCTIKIYENKTVLFQGMDSSLIASNFFAINKLHVKKNISFYENNIIGSDEVGTGDIFGPIVVTASIYNIKNKKIIERMDIKDSKLIKDHNILEYAPILIKHFPHKTIILNNEKYNEIYLKYKNINTIKAIMHNNAIGYMISKNKYEKIFIDKFTTEKKYLEHLENNNKKVNDWKNTIFEHKGESKHISVAISSIISRYYFLKEINTIQRKYNIKILLGASSEVKKLASKYKEILDEKTYQNIVKINFNLK